MSLSLFSLGAAMIIGLIPYTACFGEEFPRPVTLAEGLKVATENSRVVKIAARDRDISAADIMIARAAYFPSINTSATQTFLANQPGAIFGIFSVPTGEKSSFAFGLDVRQTLYDFGARSSRYESAKIASDEAQLNVDRVRNVVALDFVLTYLDLLETEKLRLVAAKEVESVSSHLATAGSLYDEGVITKNDLLQAEVRLSDARQRQIAVGNLRAVTAARLNNTLSRPLTEEVRTVDVSDDFPPGPDLATAWDAAERQRIELKTIDREIRLADLEETTRRSEYYPKFYAEGGFSYTENRYLLHQDNWSFLVGLDMNLFSGGRTRAEIVKIGYRKERLLEQKRKLSDDVKLEVQKSYFDRENARDRVVVTKNAVGQAEENLKINRVRYTEGVGTATDVLDAISLLTTAESNYYRAVYEVGRAQASLLYGMGADLASEYR
jgi:outer membrane protein TolC